MIDPDNVESVAGLSAMQSGMLFDHARDPGSDEYVEQFDLRSRATFDVHRLRQAFLATSRHFSVLRTTFSFHNTDEPYQLVLRELAPPVQECDLGHLEDAEAALRRFKEADRARGFDLAADPLLRCTVVRLGPGRTHLVLTFHHIILDGWSLGPLFMTLFAYYEEIVATGTWVQRDEQRPYLDYITWYEAQSGGPARQFWREQLVDHEVPTRIPVDVDGGGSVPATHTLTLGGGLTRRLQALAADNGVTVSSAFLTAWGMVLQRFNHSEDVVFGAVVSGRAAPLPDIESMVGMFVNTQPVRVSDAGGDDFVTLARRVQQQHHRATPHAWFPLHEVLAETPLRGDLIDHVVAFENYPLAEQLQTFDADDRSLGLEGVEVYERTSYGLHIVVNPGDDLRITFAFNAAAHSRALIESLAACLTGAIEAVVQHPSRPVHELAVWTPPASDPDLTPAHGEGLDRSLIAMFVDAVAGHAERVALSSRGRQWSYAELDAWSDAIAGRLDACGVGPGSPVGLLVNSRPELVVGMVAILKCGGHYVPLDTRDSTDRRAHVVADAGIETVCTVAEFADQPELPRVVDLAEPDEPGVPFAWRDQGADADAALIYTSGSTGGPKGCHISHRNVVRLVVGQEYFDFGPERVVLQTSSPAFDACTFEVWGTILHGARLVIPEQTQLLDPEALGSIIRDEHVDAMWLTAGLFNQVCDHDPSIFEPLADLLVGGSALSVPHISRLRSACPEVRVTNGYGPTENTTFSTTHQITPDDLQRPRIPIGRPLRHSRARVMDRGLHRVPPGAVGELCLGGAGLSRGYHAREDLTASTFVTEPGTGLRWYRSGDLVRELPTGDLDYLGRIDDQVKINGFRVELAEVESALRATPGVGEVAVLAVERAGVKRLHGWYVPVSDTDAVTVRADLATRLPPYMVPASLVAIAEMPLTRNGKVDRPRLTAFTDEPALPTASPRRPGNPMVALVHDAVAEVLGRDAVDEHQGFFDLGISSLDLLTLSNRLRRQLDREVPITLLFEHTTVAALARHLDARTDHPSGPAQVQEPEPMDDLPALSLFTQITDHDGDPHHD